MGPCFRRDDGGGFVLAGEPTTPPSSRPSACARRNPYAVPSRFDTRSVAFRCHYGGWLWVPAFAGTTAEDLCSLVKQQLHRRPGQALARAGTHTPCPHVLTRGQLPSVVITAGGYGSLLSQGRRRRICARW